MKKVIFIIVLIVFGLIAFHSFNSKKTIPNPVQTTEAVKKEGRTYFIYFTGIGCPHCANVDPYLLNNLVRTRDVMIIEYEIYQQRQNAPLILTYNDKYKTGLGVPLLISGELKNQSIVGDTPILDGINAAITNKNNNIVLANKSVTFKDLDIQEIPGLPKIWYKSRVAIKTTIDAPKNQTSLNQILKDFLINGTIPKDAALSDTREVPLSGDKVTFDNSKEFNGWLLMYNSPEFEFGEQYGK